MNYLHDSKCGGNGKDALTSVTGVMTLMKLQHISVDVFVCTVSSSEWFDTNKAFQSIGNNILVSHFWRVDPFQGS